MATTEEKAKNDTRFTLYLPGELLEEVKIRAARERRRVNAVIIEALEQVLKRESRGREG